MSKLEKRWRNNMPFIPAAAAIGTTLTSADASRSAANKQRDAAEEANKTQQHAQDIQQRQLDMQPI